MYVRKVLLLFICFLFLFPSLIWSDSINTLYLKKNDLQPFYYAQIKDSAGTVVSISGATIYCTMKGASTGTIKINRQTTGINITEGTNGKFEYRWQVGDTDTIGIYAIEFEVVPLVGGKYTVPTSKKALVVIEESLDTE